MHLECQNYQNRYKRSRRAARAAEAAEAVVIAAAKEDNNKDKEGRKKG